MAMATMAAYVQTASQPPALRWWTAKRDATTPTTPISTPPLPGTAVNSPARSRVRRMYCRLSMACACSSTGTVRGVAITLDDSAGTTEFQVLFVIKERGRDAGGGCCRKDEEKTRTYGGPLEKGGRSPKGEIPSRQGPPQFGLS